MMDPQTLTAVRSKLGITQEALANMLSVSFATVNRWEKGHRPMSGLALDVLLAMQSLVPYKPHRLCDKAMLKGMGSRYTWGDVLVHWCNQGRRVFLQNLFRVSYL